MEVRHVYVIADSRPESLSLIAAQHEDWIIRQAINLLEQRIFKAGPMLNSPPPRDYLHLKLVAEPNEVFAVVFLNSQHQVLAYEPMFKGTVDQTSVYPRVLVQRALALNASAVILAHQHPSGMTVPSAADQALTDRLKAALAMVDVRWWITSSSARARRTPSPNPACCSAADRLVPAGASAPAFLRLSAQSGARAVRIPCRGWTAFGVRLEPCSHSQDARHDGSLLETHPAAAGHAHRLRGRAAAVPARPGRIRSRRAVVTDSRHPVQSASGARVIELDLPERIEAELAAGLPADPGRAAALVQQRLRDGGQALQRRIGSAYQGVADAWGLGWPRCLPWWSIAATWSTASLMSRAPWHASNPIGGHSHEPPAVGVVAPGPPCHRFGAARRRRFELRAEHGHHRVLGPVTRLPQYRVVGICYWLFCTWTGCTVRTSVKVRHYIPDAVVSSYSNTGENPWIEVRAMSMPNPTAQAGGDGTTNHDNENNLAKFKNADVIGHPGGSVFSQFASTSGYARQGRRHGLHAVPAEHAGHAGLALQRTGDGVPRGADPRHARDRRRTTLNLWGNVYPRGGFLHQTDDYKSGAVVAQRAGDVVTRRMQPHVYQPLLASSSDGYWPAGALMESDAPRASGRS